MIKLANTSAIEAIVTAEVCCTRKHNTHDCNILDSSDRRPYMFNIYRSSLLFYPRTQSIRSSLICLFSRGGRRCAPGNSLCPDVPIQFPWVAETKKDATESLLQLNIHSRLH